MDDFQETILAIAERKLLHGNHYGLCSAFRDAIVETLGPCNEIIDLISYIQTIFPNFSETLGNTQWIRDERGNWGSTKVFGLSHSYVWPSDAKLPRILFINYLRNR